MKGSYLPVNRCHRVITERNLCQSINILLGHHDLDTMTSLIPTMWLFLNFFRHNNSMGFSNRTHFHWLLQSLHRHSGCIIVSLWFLPVTSTGSRILFCGPCLWIKEFRFLVWESLIITRAVGDWHPFRVVLGRTYRGLTGGNFSGISVLLFLWDLMFVFS